MILIPFQCYFLKLVLLDVSVVHKYVVLIEKICKLQIEIKEKL